jgi:hypothetical protein
MITIQPESQMDTATLRQHMIDEHGWPVERLDTGRWVDWRDVALGTRPLTHEELTIKHDVEHLHGHKFSAYRPHTHA